MMKGLNDHHLLDRVWNGQNARARNGFHDVDCELEMSGQHSAYLRSVEGPNRWIPFHLFLLHFAGLR